MKPNVAAQLDPEYMEALYERWQQDPESVDASWQLFFQGVDLASCPRDCIAAGQARDQSGVASMIYNYREQGHRMARTNPLSAPPAIIPDLELSNFGFAEKDLERIFDTGHLHLPQRATLQQIIAMLQETYCGSIGVEFLHIQDVQIRRYLESLMEPTRNRPRRESAEKRRILERLMDAEFLEKFIQARYLGQKRFSIEGGETFIPMVRWMIDLAPELGVEEIVLGMAHRGRLNVLANIMDKSETMIFAEFEDNFLPGSVFGDGDVKYHKGYSSQVTTSFGKSIKLSLTANPSHLEAVDPVVLGRARAKQRQRDDTAERKRVVPFLVHGDAAFSGQGIVAETFNLSRLKGYEVGGCVHIVINNQIGFTTLPEQGRSSYYVTDVAKMVEAPIFHVNGDDPEAAVHAAELALRYRQKFGRDVVIDLICFRRHGHSEADEPGFTQPLLYKKIRRHPTVREIYTKRLVDAGELSMEEAEKLAAQFREGLEDAYQRAKGNQTEAELDGFQGAWQGLGVPFSFEAVNTAVSREVLTEVARGITTVPEGFRLNPKIAKMLPARREAVETGSTVDWALAEALAVGSLLIENVPVRLSGQDSERGTFSQRHMVWRDTETAEPYTPLNHLRSPQGRLCVYNSPLSEASVLGFEHGYSLSEPHMVIMWEAQFGDFVNGAQVIIDQFIVAARSKWQRYSGLVLLLPHGFEGQGPEHSNAYLERYLAACAEENIQVCVPTTPAQYFHVLRRQVKRPFRLPLILMTPKSLLRHALAVSPVDDLVKGEFQEVLPDPGAPPETRRLVLCTGKVYYDLLEARESNSLEHLELVRVEQLYPFPVDELKTIAENRQSLQEVVWAQEEPMNRGAWTYIEPRLRGLFPGMTIQYAGRDASASPAVGSLKTHRREQAALVGDALGIGGEQP
ncbi:MAG: 2-oxoglutarate dehydrogenase E1 component [bacterium]|nr:2-oxoglutarate dehydrogenase E1 component [bacterium]